MNILTNNIISVLQTIIIKNDIHGAELEYWNNFKNESINQSESQIINRAIEKELDGLLRSYKHESEKQHIPPSELQKISHIFQEYWLNNDDPLYSNLFKCFDSNLLLGNELGTGFATFDSNELIGYEILEKIISTYIYLYKYENKRFSQNNRTKNDKIKMLHKSINIAENYNNYYLINELTAMITLIDNEDYITKEIIYKNCFYSVHQILISKTNYWNNTQPLAKETKAKDIANQILEDFFSINIEYKPSNNIGQKEFYELGNNEPRIFYYYLSK